MFARRITRFALGLSIAAGFSSLTLADLGPLDAMVMPGKLTKAHAKLESKCSNCHVPFRKSAQADLCVGCHDHADVAEDVETGRGYHGRINERQCNACHTEHKGRNMNIVPLNKKTFDHNFTDYPLVGAHAGPNIKCENCHKPGLKYRDAPSRCYACHKKDDVHKGKLGEACENCHVERSWEETRFNHNRTRFPLVGRHRLVKCSSCHVNERYKGTPKTCYACHRSDDNKKGHKGRFGKRCETCHTPKGWAISIFNHNRNTGFRLRGKHRGLKCTACHKGILYKEELGTSCFSCHEKDDAHKGQQGTKCERCHNERSWKGKVFFDHGLTRFPLLGKHAKLACKDCHRKTTFKDASIECVSCHNKDDVHARRLGPLCEQCHNARDWREWDFDHDTRTKFHLNGAHEGLDCHACHKTRVKKKIRLATGCVSCHSADDVHREAYGRFCEQCHVTSSFSHIKGSAGSIQ